MINFLQSIYQYRGFITSSVQRDFQLRYQSSLLGSIWLIIQPLTMILVYTLVLANVMQTRLDGVNDKFSYSIYLCAGVLTWGLFTEILNRSTRVFLDNANLLKKLKFPKICLPIIIICSALLNFLIIFVLFSLFLIVSNHFPGGIYLISLPIILLLTLFSTGLGMVLGVLNVFFRDVGQLINVATQLLFWLTPIVYPIEILPKVIQKIIILNPLVPIIQSMQIIFTHQQVPQWSVLIYPAVLALIFLGIGMRLFHKHSGEIMDEI